MAKNSRSARESPEETEDARTTFIGAKIHRSTYTRLVRAKASIEYDSGETMGMGKLIDSVLVKGLDSMESANGGSDGKL